MWFQAGITGDTSCHPALFNGWVAAGTYIWTWLWRFLGRNVSALVITGTPPPVSQRANFSFTFLICYFCLKLLLINLLLCCAECNKIFDLDHQCSQLCFVFEKTRCLIAKLCNYLPFLTPLIILRQAPAGVSALMHFIDIIQWVVKTFHIHLTALNRANWKAQDQDRISNPLHLLSNKKKNSIYSNEFIWLPSAFIFWADLQLWLISRSFIPLEWLQRTQGCPSSRS